MADESGFSTGDEPTPMPLAELLGIRIASETPERVVCTMAVTTLHLNQGLIGHGGALFTLADTAVGVLTNRPGGEARVGTGFSLELYRAVRVGDVIEAVATTEHRSRSVQFCRVRLRRPPDPREIGSLSVQLLRAAERPAEVARPHLRTDGTGSPLVSAMTTMRRREGDPGEALADEESGDVVVLVFDGDEPRGYATVRLGVGARLIDVWVHPGWRGLGLGRLLLTDAVRVAQGGDPC